MNKSLLENIRQVKQDIIKHGETENNPRVLERDIELLRSLDVIEEIVEQGFRIGSELKDVFNPTDHEYNLIGENILRNGVVKDDRTGTGTLSTFGQKMAFDISCGKIPLLTTKKVHLRMVIHELIWMLSGDTNIRYLKENNVGIWDSWIDPDTAEFGKVSVDEIIAEAEEKGLQDEMEKHVAKSIALDVLEQYSTTPIEELKKGNPINVKETLNNILNAFNDGHSDTKNIVNVITAIRQFGELSGLKTEKLVAGDLPNVYGKQWRHWKDTRVVPSSDWSIGVYDGLGYIDVGGYEAGNTGTEVTVIHRDIDQIANIVDQLKNNPDSRRIILNAWNVSEIDQMALPPCHAMFQLWTRKLTIGERLEIAKQRHITVIEKDWIGGPEPEGEEKFHAFLTSLEIPERELSSQLYQRSADFCLGVPFNIAQYSILTHLLAHVCNMTTSEFTWIGGDTHLYSNQIEQFAEQIKRESKSSTPWIMINPAKKNINNVFFEDIKLFDYESHPAIKFPAAAV